MKINQVIKHDSKNTKAYKAEIFLRNIQITKAAVNGKTYKEISVIVSISCSAVAQIARKTLRMSMRLKYDDSELDSLEAPRDYDVIAMVRRNKDYWLGRLDSMEQCI